MYTLEELQDKTFKELKEIGWQLNVLPAGDRRQKQTWIDALVGAKLPWLELLEVSPAVEVEPVAEVLLESLPEALECPACGAVHALFTDSDCLDRRVIRCLHCSYSRFKNYLGAIRLEAQEPIEIQRQESIKYGRITGYFCCPKPIAPAAKTSPGVENCTEADRPPNRGDSGRGRIKSETEMLESAIGSAAKNLLDAEADDRNPILTGVTFSDSFLARYSPPQSENIHYQADANGQLSLLDFEVESEDEPPDPDDFECMFAFWAAYDAWCDRTDDDSEQFEPLEISLTSMCEWAPCPLEWYEPETNETNETVSCTLEISPVSVESSSTCKFLIPVFDGFADRPNRQNDKDEPPDTGIFARLPGPKPPKFPPMVVAEGDGVPPRKLRTNSKKLARSATLLSGRAPPGGDAMS